MNKVRKYFEDRFETAETRNSNIRLFDCECPYCGKREKVYIKCKGRGVGYCQKCGQGFRAVDFIMEYEDCGPKEAYKILNGLEVDKWIYEKKEIKESEPEKRVPYFPELKNLNAEATKYLTGRGLSKELIKKYKFRMCKANGNYKGKTVWSANRVIAPIFDKNNNLVSWQGRSLNSNCKVKYLFSPDFEKSKYIYNNWNLKPKPDYLIVCEGIFDCLGWIGKGFVNCAATFGKSASKTQIKLLRDLDPKVLFLAWDYDCIHNMIELFEEYGHFFREIRIISLPAEKDSDQCEKKELLNAFKNAKAPLWHDKVLSALF